MCITVVVALAVPLAKGQGPRLVNGEGGVCKGLRWLRSRLDMIHDVVIGCSTKILQTKRITIMDGSVSQNKNDSYSDPVNFHAHVHTQVPFTDTGS